jgi:hypothetical protein
VSQFTEGYFDVVRVQVHLRTAVALLIATTGERVNAQWITIGSGLGFFDEYAEDSSLRMIECLPLFGRYFG